MKTPMWQVRFATAVLVILVVVGGACHDVTEAPQGNAMAALTAGGANYYVSPSPTGDDGNPCTLTAPCYTMQRVGQLMTPGATAHFAPGTYTWNTSQTLGSSGTESARVTYVSDTPWGAKIVITSCDSYIIGNRGDYVDIIGFDMTGACVHNGIIQGDGLKGNFGRIIGNRVHDLPTPDTSFADGAIILSCCSPYANSGNQVIGNLVDSIGPFLGGQSQSNTTHGIYVAGPYAVVENNIVTRAAAACIQTYHGATHAIISNNVVANCGRYGITISADSNVTANDTTTVDNNIVVNVRDSAGGYYGYGIWESPYGLTGCHNVYYNNIVYHNRLNFYLSSCADSSANLTLTDAQFSGLFVNYTGDKNGNYHLQSSAVAIDAGTTRCAVGVTPPCVPSADFDGYPRPYGAAYDIGAYEWHP